MFVCYIYTYTSIDYSIIATHVCMLHIHVYIYTLQYHGHPGLYVTYTRIHPYTTVSWPSRCVCYIYTYKPIHYSIMATQVCMLHIHVNIHTLQYHGHPGVYVTYTRIHPYTTVSWPPRIVCYIYTYKPIHYSIIATHVCMLHIHVYTHTLQYHCYPGLYVTYTRIQPYSTVSWPPMCVCYIYTYTSIHYSIMDTQVCMLHIHVYIRTLQYHGHPGVYVTYTRIHPYITVS